MVGIFDDEKELPVTPLPKCVFAPKFPKNSEITPLDRLKNSEISPIFAKIWAKNEKFLKLFI